MTTFHIVSDERAFLGITYYVAWAASHKEDGTWVAPVMALNAPEDAEPLHVQHPTYDFTAPRRFVGFDRDRLEDKALIWASRKLARRSRTSTRST